MYAESGEAEALAKAEQTADELAYFLDRFSRQMFEIEFHFFELFLIDRFCEPRPLKSLIAERARPFVSVFVHEMRTP